MPLTFHQRPLIEGVYHILIDDGHTVRHIFSECAPWSLVAKAAAKGSSEYAAQHWRRKQLANDDLVMSAAPIVAHADAAVVYAVTGRTLTLVAHHGWCEDALEGWDKLPANVDLPVPTAARTGRPRFYRNAAQMEAAHPGLAGATADFYGSFLALPIGANGVALMAWRDELDVCESQLLAMLGAE